jgi:hypothetical protein
MDSFLLYSHAPIPPSSFLFAIPHVVMIRIGLTLAILICHTELVLTVLVLFAGLALTVRMFFTELGFNVTVASVLGPHLGMPGDKTIWVPQGGKLFRCSILLLFIIPSCHCSIVPLIH